MAEFDWKSLVKTVAPWIGTAIAGPFGGMAINAIGDALGLDDKTEEGIKNALAGVTPEQTLALKKADQDFAAHMQEIGYKNIETLAALAVENTKSARTMQTMTRSKVPAALAILITIGFFGVLIVMMTGSYKPSDNQALLILLGALSAAWGAVVNFYFGSSSDSSRKTELLYQAQPPK